MDNSFVKTIVTFVLKENFLYEGVWSLNGCRMLTVHTLTSTYSTTHSSPILTTWLFPPLIDVSDAGYSFITNPWWSMPFEALECFTVSLMSAAAVSYAADLATPSTLATLQGMYGGIYYGVGECFLSEVESEKMVISQPAIIKQHFSLISWTYLRSNA